MKKLSRKFLSLLFALLLVIGAFSTSVLPASAATVLQQADSRWASYAYGTSNLGDGACGLFANLNAVSYLTGCSFSTGDIHTWADYAGANYHITGVGSAHTITGGLAAHFGTAYNYKRSSNYEFGTYMTLTSNSWGASYPATVAGYNLVWAKLTQELAAGRVAVGLVYGHFIAIVDYDAATDKVLVYDSAAWSSGRGTTVYGNWKSKNELSVHSTAGYVRLKLRCCLNFLEATNTVKIGLNDFSHANIAEGSFVLTNYESGRCLNVPGNSDTSLTALTIFTRDYSTGQTFNFAKASDGYYTMSPACSTTGKVVNVNGDTSANGAVVSIYPPTGDDTQEWVFEKTNAGYYVIHSVDNPTYVLAETGTTSTSAIQLQTYTGNANQLWTIAFADNSGEPVEQETIWVHYNNNGGTGAPVSQTKLANQTINLTSVIPTRDGYHFLGWSFLMTATEPNYLSGASYSEQETHTLYATWASNNYTLTFNLNGGSGSTSVTKYYTESVALSGYQPTKSGYTFLGWSSVSDGSLMSYGPSDTYAEGKSATLYAVWQENVSYTVTYNANNGSGAPASQSTTGSVTLSATVPTRSGYTFLGWATTSTATSAAYSAGQTISISANTTLYAVWRQNTYTLSYNANNGSGAPASQSTTGSVTLSATVPTRSGYTFLGWATTSTATSAAYSAGQTISISANTTLYAVWQKITAASVTLSYGSSMDFDGNAIVFTVNASDIPATATAIRAEVSHIDMATNAKSAVTTFDGLTAANGSYTFRYNKLGLTDMRGTCSAVFSYTNDGVRYTAQTYTASIESCCRALLAASGTSAAVKTLAVDTLNVGAAAQTYYGVATSTLANANIAAYQSYASTAKPMANVSSYANGTTGIDLNASAAIRDGITITYAVSKSALSGAGVTVSANNAFVRVIRQDTGAYTDIAYTGSDSSNYYFAYTLADANNYGAVLYATLFCDGMSVTKTRVYSAESALSTFASGSDANAAAFASAYGCYRRSLAGV